MKKTKKWTREEFHKIVEDWHTADTDLPVWKYIGVSCDEYEDLVCGAFFEKAYIFGEISDED